MSADLNHIVEVVETIMAAEMPSGTYTVDGKTVLWRNLDDGENDSQPRLTTTQVLIEFEYVDAENRRGEYGSPGCNRWEENSAFMVHVHAPRGKGDMTLAKKVMSAVINTLCGRQVGSVQIRDALAAYYDGQGSGLTRGVSRAIKYQYEYRGR